MKITKSQLKQIIKEELSKILNERVTTPEGDFLRKLGITADQPAGVELTDLPPEAMEELSQIMNQPNVQKIKDDDRRAYLMNKMIDRLKKKYGVEE